jgi:hypothetical protein
MRRQLMPRWEYFVLRTLAGIWWDESGRQHRLDDKKGLTLTSLLNELGAQGWELAGVGGYSGELWAFKRSLND